MSSEKSKKEKDSVQSVTDEWMKPFFAQPNSNLVTSAAHLSGLMLQTATRFNLEALGFMLHRVQQDMALAEKMARCTDVSDLTAFTTEFSQTAMEEYSKEASTLANLCSELSTQAARQVQSELMSNKTSA